MNLSLRRNPTARTPAVLVALALLTTAGCAGNDDGPPAATTASATPHGYVAGAQESAEQQSRLLLSDPGTGQTRVLDLITGKTHRTALRPGTARLTTDGRFGYFHAADGTHVLDGGAWMVDHGDHVHYYRAAIRDVGRMSAGAGARVRSDTALTAVTGEDGRAVLHARADLEKGGVGTPARYPGRTPRRWCRTRNTC